MLIKRVVLFKNIPTALQHVYMLTSYARLTLMLSAR